MRPLLRELSALKTSLYVDIIAILSFLFHPHDTDTEYFGAQVLINQHTDRSGQITLLKSRRPTGTGGESSSTTG